MGLVDVDTLRATAPIYSYDAQQSGEGEGRSAPGRGAVGTLSAGGRPAQTPENPEKKAAFPTLAAAVPESAVRPATHGTSYRSGITMAAQAS